MPGLAKRPPQLPEWWPPSRKVSFRLKLSVPRVPPKMVGRRWSSRGPSEPIRASALSAALLALQKSARPGEPVSSPVSIRIVELKPSEPRSCSTQARAAILIVCWPLLSAVPRPYMPVALDHDLPRRQALPPLLLLAADHVAVAVGQDGGLGWHPRPVARSGTGHIRCAGWAARCSRSRAFRAIRSSRPRRTAAGPAWNPAPGWWSESPRAAAARPESRPRRNTFLRARWRHPAIRS